MEKIIRNELGSVSFDKEKKILFEEFSGRVHIEKAKEIFSKELQFAEKHKILGICSDITNLVGTFTHFNTFFQNDYFPTLIQKGLVCNCIIVSNDIFTQFATENLITRLGNFEIKTFNNKEEGCKWVEDMIAKKE
ncbi:MAG: hypothetical protein R6W78_16925 [Bacteroidales bacterium]